MTTPPSDGMDVSNRRLPAGRWNVQMMGRLLLRNGDVVIERFESAAVTLLFARLALSPRTTHARDELALALWPEMTDGRGHEPADADNIRRGRLRRVLSKLRVQLERPGVLPEHAIVADRDTVRLNADAFDIDTARFEAHIARGQWEAARATYRGEFLPGLRDPWVDAHRARLAALLDRADGERALTRPDPDVDDDDPDAAPERSAGREPRRGPIVPYVTRFFGREAEIECLREAIEAHRVITITGPGGCGKTRLAAEAAARSQGFDPVVLVALADCTAPAYVCEHLRAALGLQPVARSALEQVVARLAGQRVLLILDNFEHLVGAAADAVLDTLLARLPGARFVLTSRRALRRADEHHLALNSLPVPEAGTGVEAATHNAAVVLFLDRARAARSDFHLGARNVDAVVEVCRLLDGLPLAIELAAARLRHHAPREMAQALRHGGLELLARPRTRSAEPSQHASLQAVLAWSWALLTPPERDLLGHLSAFRGGFTVEQVHAVAPGPTTDSALDALARDSLLRMQPAAEGPPRLRLLVLVREFVESLSRPADAAAWRHRHRTHFLAWVTELGSRGEWPREADLPNLVEALASACADEDLDTAAALALELGGHWLARGAPERALALLDGIARDARVPVARRVSLMTLLSCLFVTAGRMKQANAHVMLALQAAGGDLARRAEATFAHATLVWRAGRTDRNRARAHALAREAEELAAAGDGMPLRGRILLLKGAITLEYLGDPLGAALVFEQAERLFGRLRDRRASVLALPGRSACLLAQGRFREAIAVASAGEQLAAEFGDVATRLQLLDRLSCAYEMSEQPDRAIEVSRRQTRLASAHGMAYYIAFGAWNQCQPLARLGQPETAARLMAFACRYWVEQFGQLGAQDERYVDDVREIVSGQIGPARLQTFWSLGQAMPVREGIELAAGAASEPPAVPPG